MFLLHAIYGPQQWTNPLQDRSGRPQTEFPQPERPNRQQEFPQAVYMAWPS